MEMNTAGRVSRVGAGRRRLGWAPGFGRHGRTALSSSPRTRGSSGSFWGGWRVDSSSGTKRVYKDSPAAEAPREGHFQLLVDTTEHYATS